VTFYVRDVYYFAVETKASPVHQKIFE